VGELFDHECKNRPPLGQDLDVPEKGATRFESCAAAPVHPSLA
jgi:hypothetical protein